jgi:nickel transport protein
MLLFLMFFSIKAAVAHRVNIHALQEGRVVKVHAYWVDGTDAQRALLKAVDTKGEVVFMGLTDDQGICMFSLPQAGKYNLIFDAGMGHRAETMLEYSLPSDLKVSEDQVLASLAPSRASKGDAVSGGVSGAGVDGSVDDRFPLDGCKVPATLLRQIDSMLDRKLRPVLDELAGLRERNNRIRIRDVTAGLGYILGLAGFAAWFSARKRRSENVMRFDDSSSHGPDQT